VCSSDLSRQLQPQPSRRATGDQENHEREPIRFSALSVHAEQSYARRRKQSHVEKEREPQPFSSAADVARYQLPL